MARFPHYQKNIRKLGEILARARTDETFRKQLMDNPKAGLAEVELPDCVNALMTFEIVDGANQKATALPYRLNQNRLDQRDPAYLSKIAQSFTTIN